MFFSKSPRLSATPSVSRPGTADGTAVPPPLSGPISQESVAVPIAIGPMTRAPTTFGQTSDGDLPPWPASPPLSPAFGPTSLPMDESPSQLFGFSLRSPGREFERRACGSRTPSPSRPMGLLVVQSRRWRALPPYPCLPPLQLTPAQVERVPEFDLLHGERELKAIASPVAILRGEVAHVYDYPWLMKWWNANKTHPHTGEVVGANEFYRVTNNRPGELDLADAFSELFKETASPP